MNTCHWIGIGCMTAFAMGVVLENTALLNVTNDVLTPMEGLTHLPKLVHISDLHKKQFGAHNCRLLEKTAAQKPEYIVITGDLVSRDVSDFTEAEQLLAGLCRIAPVVMCIGNHELDLPPHLLEHYREMVNRCGVHLLENETISLGGVRFAGLRLTAAHYRSASGYRGLAGLTAADITAALGECQPETVLLCHDPLFMQAFAEWGAPLVLAGHMHGGVVRLPKIGGLLSPERKFFPQYDKGRYQMGQTTMIVSGGLGKLRVANPSEIRVISMQQRKSAADDDIS